MNDLINGLNEISRRYYKLSPSVGYMIPICEIVAVIHATRSGDNLPVLLWFVAATATLLFYE